MDAVATLRAWGGVPEGESWRTTSSELVRGRLGDAEVVLKVAATEEERRGARLMAWWAGRGAARVLRHDGDAVLLERVVGRGDLVAMSRRGRDDEATRILAMTAVRLHDIERPPTAVGLLPLETWFSALLDTDQADPLLRRCAGVAREVLDSTGVDDVVALHGDIHHGNVLDNGTDWLAIDPKGLYGHRAFDLANVFVNPRERVADLLPRRLAIVSEVTGLDEELVRAWTVAWCGLSLAWLDEETSWHSRSCRTVADALLGGPLSARD